MFPSGIGSDWTLAGAKALSLDFYGQVGNPVTESLWVQLQGSTGYGDKVFYGDSAGEDLADFNEASWHNWLIDLNLLQTNLSYSNIPKGLSSRSR